MSKNRGDKFPIFFLKIRLFLIFFPFFSWIFKYKFWIREKIGKNIPNFFRTVSLFFKFYFLFDENLESGKRMGKRFLIHFKNSLSYFFPNYFLKKFSEFIFLLFLKFFFLIVFQILCPVFFRNPFFLVSKFVFLSFFRILFPIF